MVGAKSFRRLISQGGSRKILCAFVLFILSLSTAPAITDVYAQNINHPFLFASNPIHPTGVLTPRAYLPIVLKGYDIPSGIYGYVTQSGLPEAGVTLALWHGYLTTENVVATTVTDSSGYYAFHKVPSITQGTGNGYFVRYAYDIGNNDNVLGRLSYWKTHVIEAYTTDQKFNIGNFDIGDVELVSPGYSDSQKLPITFYWKERPQITSDSYQLIFLNGFSTPLLGYMDRYTLSNLNGMNLNSPYGWYVTINETDGAKGLSRFMRSITFIP